MIIHLKENIKQIFIKYLYKFIKNQQIIFEQ